MALEALRAGQTLLYPTDTIWGIGCDACNADAVERIYAVKQRDHAKSMLVLSGESMLSGAMPADVRALLLECERPTTVVMPRDLIDAALADNLPAQDGTVGVRVPRMAFCQTLLAGLGHPIVSTSANFSGEPSPTRYEDISAALKGRIDCCLEDCPSFHHPDIGSSRIIKITTTGEVVVIRD